MVLLTLGLAVSISSLSVATSSEAAAQKSIPASVLTVATDGDDENDAVSRPVRSLARALEIAREMRASSSQKIRIEVVISGGTYRVNTPITLTGADSGSPDAPLLIRANSSDPVIFAGATQLTRWVNRANGEVAASLPTDGACPQQLFVNGVRRFRPRLPERDFYEIAAAPPADGLKDQFQARPGDLPANFQPDAETEAVVLDAWIVSRMRVASYDKKGRTLHLQRSIPGRNKHGITPGVPFYLDNVPAANLKPGTWRCESSEHIVRYRPLPEELGKPIEATAPVPEQLLVLRGSKSAPVHDIEINGVRFAYTAWRLPPDGWRGHSKETGATGVIEMSRCKNIRLTKLSIAHSGGAGVVIGNGCSDVELSDSTLSDLGGGGVAIGDDRRKIPEGTTWLTAQRAAGITHHIRIERNRLDGMGRVLAGSPGIWSGQAHHVAIIGNTVHDLYWTGIDVGWIRGGGTGLIEANEVRDNRIDLFGQGILSDMGGIHMVGAQPRTLVQGNTISRGSYRKYGAWGLYSDEGNEGVRFIGNRITDTQSAAIHVHKPGHSLLFMDNTAERVGEAGIRCTKGNARAEVRFEGNLIRPLPNVPATLLCSGLGYQVN